MSDAIVPIKKQLGAYYTPYRVARLLTDWAIDGSESGILDPCFGGGVFVQAALDTLGNLGVPEDARHVFGVDVNPGALQEASMHGDTYCENLLVGNFLAIETLNLPLTKFDAIVGNPPFIRHHLLSSDDKRVCRALSARSGVSLPGTANLWSFFVLKAVEVLKKGGKLALILPETVIQSEYGRLVQGYLCRIFSEITLVRGRERIFDDICEIAVVLLAKGAGEGGGSIRVIDISGFEDFEEEIQAGAMASSVVSFQNRSLPNRNADRLLKTLVSSDDVTQFGKVADMRIGLVTGANSHFLFDKERVIESGIPLRCFSPILTTLPSQYGYAFSQADYLRNVQDGLPSYLLDLEQEDARLVSVNRWIEEGELLGIHSRSHCRRREPWYVLGELDCPDAFLSSVSGFAPTFVRNSASMPCTNSIHRFRLKKSVALRNFFLTVNSTLGQAYAETCGRVFGGGALKLDPAEWQNMPCVIGSVPYEYAVEVGRKLKEGNHCEAIAIADRAILTELLGISQSDVKELRRSVSKLRAARTDIWRREDSLEAIHDERK